MATFNKVLCSLVVALVICFVGGFMMSGCNASVGSSGGTEEYKVVEYFGNSVVKNEELLNELGKQGWKLRVIDFNKEIFYLAR